MRSILVTGGAGFVGSTLVRQLLTIDSVERVVVLDLLANPAGRANLAGVLDDPRLTLVEADVADRPGLAHLITTHRVTGAFHLADEARENRSLQVPEDFVATNLVGTANLLDVCRLTRVPLLYCSSTDVCGSIEPPARATEDFPLLPFSPHAATKAGAELLCLAAHRIHRQDVIVTRSSKNYGPRPHRDDLIPRVVAHALRDEPIEFGGRGMDIRDWVHVSDHCRGMLEAFVKKGSAGQIFHFGGNCERTDLGVARNVLKILGKPESLLSDKEAAATVNTRGAIDCAKALRYFGWRPAGSLQKTLPDLVREIAANLSAGQPTG